jgi:hypothetical protein
MELCFRHWARCNVMSTDRVNYKVFRWAFRNAEKSSNCVITFLCKIFSKSVYRSKLHSLNFVIILKHQFFFLLTVFLKLFKEVFETEMYLSKNISSRYRSAFAKFRCGVAPLRIETGRYVHYSF